MKDGCGISENPVQSGHFLARCFTLTYNPFIFANCFLCFDTFVVLKSRNLLDFIINQQKPSKKHGCLNVCFILTLYYQHMITDYYGINTHSHPENLIETGHTEAEHP